MLYFDTSFLVPLILPEATSGKIEKFVRALPVQEFAVSHWTRVEFSSLLAREVRVGGLDGESAARAKDRFEAMVEESFAVISPNGADFDRAMEYLANYATGLRAGDALHLAIAWDRRADAVFSLDKTLIKAGRLLGLPVNRGI